MKKRAIIYLSFLIILFFIASIPSEAQNVSFKLEVVTDQANIRQKPDLGSTLICQVPQGTILESTGKEGEWYLVTVKTEEEKLVSGYVHESLVIRIKQFEEKVVLDKEKKEVSVERREEKEEKPIIHPPPVISIPERPRKFNFAFNFYGGGNYFSGEDLNKGIRGFAQFYSEELGIEEKVEVNQVHLGYLIGGELSIALSPQVFFGIGLDYFQGKKESLVVNQVNASKATFSTRPKIQAIPLRIVVSYHFLRFLFLKGGVEYYFTKCSYFNRFDGKGSWEEKSGQAHARGFGILGALGAELNIASNLSFIIEAAGRYSRIGGLTGNGTRTNSRGLNSTEEGTLYLYHKLNVYQHSYPQVEIRGKKPAEGGEVDPRREAYLDLSGISFKMGFKIKF